MAELTDQQGHLQQVLEQQKTLVAEINELNNTVATKREMALKLQGVREYLEQTGVTLPEPEAPAEGEAAAEPAATEVVEGE
mgnify:FL=1|jgi:hypothetical protein|tara:strand:+ start:1043 stop:1285 length:243 start_codon:yes stop_codon:yes gene_type:complete